LPDVVGSDRGEGTWHSSWSAISCPHWTVWPSAALQLPAPSSTRAPAVAWTPTQLVEPGPGPAQLASCGNPFVWRIQSYGADLLFGRGHWPLAWPSWP